MRFFLSGCTRVKPDTFHKMLLILQKEFDAPHKDGAGLPNRRPKEGEKAYYSGKKAARAKEPGNHWAGQFENP
jgi:hypothetical protein